MIWYGNAGTLIVHADDCEYAAAMHPDNLETFDSLVSALQTGYEECGWCIKGGRERSGKVAVIRRIGHAIRARCAICPETRGVQRAHIVPRRDGGKETMPLCPNHHWNYDHGLLTDGEMLLLKRYLWARGYTRTSDAGVAA